MILLRRLQFEGIGPYRSMQTVEFGGGVTVIEGENGTGKTRLFRALRFALHGDPGEGIDLDDLVNKYNAKLGDPTMKTILFFDYEPPNGDPQFVEVTRTYEIGKDSEMIVSVDGTTLPEKQGQALVKTLFAPSLASFYFFEAERLEEYEAAVGGGPRSGDVSQTIERLLGIPALDHAADDSKEASSSATKRIAQAQGQNDKVQGLKNDLVMIEEQIKSYEDQMEKARERRQRELAIIDEIEKELGQYERYKELLDKRKEQETIREEQTKAAAVARSKLNTLGSFAWIGVIEEDLRQRRDDIRREFEDLAFQLGSRKVHQAHQAHLQNHATCPTCASKLSAETRDATLGRLTRELGGATTSDLEARLSHLSTALTQIQDALDQSRSGEISLLAKDINESLAKARDAANAIERLKKEMQKSGVRDDDYRDLVTQHTKAEQKAESDRRSIEETQHRLEELRQAAKGVQKAITDAAGAQIRPEDRAASRAASLLNDVFEDAANRARSIVQNEIQKKAQDFFLTVSADRGYGGLVLDSSYKVTVVDEEGAPVSQPSAGYKQLVVLSLASALMRTTPEAGPVIMDMPFGRLDPHRTAEVLKALPLLSEQVIIFVFPDEGGPEAIQNLGSDVHAIYDIVPYNWDDSVVRLRQTEKGAPS